MQHFLKLRKELHQFFSDVENLNLYWANSLSIKCTKYILAEIDFVSIS